MENTDAADRDRIDMSRLVAGSDAALNSLMERHRTPVFHFLFRLLGNEADARDLAQETFVRVYQHRARFRPDAKFSTWLFAIAANLARNHHRWRARHPNVSLDAPDDKADQTLGDRLSATGSSPENALLAEERGAAVRAAVEGLPEDMREAIVLCEWEELAMAEAAAILKTTPKAIENRLYRARKILREKLRNWL
jgi:RNA polymerase sigma-70 factor (ECF subfamily)